MEVNTRALGNSEQSFRKATNDIRRICSDIDSVARILGSMKSLDVLSRRLKYIINDLECSGTSLSQMSCFLEMANETYLRTEQRIEDRCGLHMFFNHVIAVKMNSPAIIDFPRISATENDGDLGQIFKSIESD